MGSIPNTNKWGVSGLSYEQHESSPTAERWGTRLMSSPLRHVILVVGCFVVMQFCGCPNPARHMLQFQDEGKWKRKYFKTFSNKESYLSVYSISLFDNRFFDYYRIYINIECKRLVDDDEWNFTEPNIKVWIDDVEMSTCGNYHKVGRWDKYERILYEYCIILGPRREFEKFLLNRYYNKSIDQIKFKIWTDKSITYKGRSLLPDTLYAVDKKLLDFHPKYLKDE